MKENSELAQDTNVTIQLQLILKVREILTQQSNERECYTFARY